MKSFFKTLFSKIDNHRRKKSKVVIFSPAGNPEPIQELIETPNRQAFQILDPFILYPEGAVYFQGFQAPDSWRRAEEYDFMQGLKDLVLLNIEKKLLVFHPAFQKEIVMSI